MKNYLISHIKDVDGVTPVILMNLCHLDFDYQLLDVYEVEEFMNSFLERNLDEYDHIYITDLTLPESIYKKLEIHPAKDKFKVFDHHKTHRHALKYSFVTLDMDECGTTLFYQYLKQNYKIETPSLEQYIKSVKNLDLWLFEQNKDLLAPILCSLFDLYGELRYIDEMTERLTKVKEEFVLTTFEKELLKLEQENQKRYIDKKELHLQNVMIDGIKAGLVFAEKYRSEIGHELLNRHPELEFIIIINMSGGISFRSRSVDISNLAHELDGGGHPQAAGIPVKKESILNFLDHQFKGKITYED